MAWRRSTGFVALLGAIACSSAERTPDEASKTLRGELGVNDVAILFPLPASGELDRLLSPADSGARGALLPLSVFEHAPALTPGADPAARYAALRVVSVRIDPCFPSLVDAPSPACRFQVRLVLQPTFDDGAKIWTEDAALHLFYDLPAGDFVELLADLIELQHAASPIPRHARLDVHPTLSAEGLAGPYATGLRAALLARIGAERLTRMTFMQLGAPQGSWTFGGFDLDGPSATPIGILSSNVTAQSFSNANSLDPLSFSGSVAPEMGSLPEDLGPLYDSAAASQRSDDELWPLYEAILRIENPERHSPESVDCVSCHTAQPARLWLERNTALAERASPFRFTSAFDLEIEPIADTTSVLRAFGWHDTRPAITARVANESAAVAAYLNAKVLVQP